MTKTIALALATVAFASAATAGSVTSVTKAQNLLDDYGFSVDAGDLSNNQIAAFNFVEDGDDSKVRAEIRAILN